MKFTYDPNLYELEDGVHLAQFNGVKPFDASKSKDPQANTYGPAVTWSFTVVDGENKGKEANVITAQRPSKKNSCIRMIAGIIGYPPKEMEEVDIDQFKGQYYAITVHDGRLSHQFPPRRMGATYNQAMAAFNPDWQPAAVDPNSTVPF